MNKLKVPRYFMRVRALIIGIRHFFMSSVRSVTLRFYSVTPLGLNIQLRILTAETQSSQRRGNLPYYQHLKKK
jgi:hypothetical protein